MDLIIAAIGLLLGNISWAYFVTQNWPTACDRSWFQLMTLVTVAIIRHFINLQ